MFRALLIFYFLIHSFAFSQQSNQLGRWTSYLTLKTGVDLVVRKNVSFMVTTSGLVALDLSTWYMNEYTKTNGLSDILPNCIAHDKETDYIFIGYNSGIIDFFLNPEQKIWSIRDIYLNRNYLSKNIHQMKFKDGRMYICTDFGVVVYDLKKLETRFSFTKIAQNNSNLPVFSIDFFKGKIYVGMSNGLYVADENHPNLSDPSAWQMVNQIPNSKVSKIEVTRSQSGNERLYIAQNNVIFYLENGQFSILDSSRFVIKKITNLKADRNRLYISTQSTISGETSGNTFIYVNDTLHAERYGDAVVATSASEDLYYAVQVDANQGLLLLDEWNVYPVTPESPPNNFCNQIVSGYGELYVAPLGYGDAKVPAYSNHGVYYFNLNERKWKILNRINGGLDTLRGNRDLCTAYFDKSTKTAYLGSWGQGYSTFQNGKLTGAFFNDNTNLVGTTLTNNGYTDIRVSGIAKDKNGNTWFTTYLANRPLAVLTNDGKWFTFPQSLFGNQSKISNLLIDDFNQKWVLVDGHGIYVFNDNNTIEQFNDDKSRYIGTGFGRGNLSSDYVYSMAKDLNGNIWIGTNKGVNVFYNPGNIFDNSNLSDAVCPIIEGFCLLRDETVKAIAIDGANRKWLGTNNGVFLVNRDGNELILHFNQSNSPLISNVISDIAIEPNTGEVFFATSQGIVSYMGDANDALESTTDLLVFPNPVKREFDGEVTIRNIVVNSTVKITTVDGRLVKELKSLGGQAVWDRRDILGNKVEPGIYLILVSDEQGKNTSIQKILIL